MIKLTASEYYKAIDYVEEIYNEFREIQPNDLWRNLVQSHEIDEGFITLEQGEYIERISNDDGLLLTYSFYDFHTTVTYMIDGSVQVEYFNC